MATITKPGGQLFADRGGVGHNRALIARAVRVQMATTDLVAANVLQVMWVPKGFVVTNMAVGATQCDSNGAPTLTFQVGDVGLAARFLATSTIAQAAAGGFSNTMAPAGHFFKFAADTQILITIVGGAATAVAGIITIFLEGFVDENFA